RRRATPAAGLAFGRARRASPLVAAPPCRETRSGPHGSRAPPHRAPPRRGTAYPWRRRRRERGRACAARRRGRRSAFWILDFGFWIQLPFGDYNPAMLQRNLAALLLFVALTA